MVSGKNESAGHNRSAKTNTANRYLKSALVEAAQAVGRNHDTHLADQDHRRAARRDKKRAAVAVAHSILVIAFHIIRSGTAYIGLATNYFDERKAEAVENQLAKRLERPGFKVSLEPHFQAA